MKNNTVLKIGILGAARITPAALVVPARVIHSVELAAVAARDRQRADAFAAAHGISRVFDCYQDLLDEPGIDAIYNPLPNGLHCEWSIKALEAGKHVLCEKPFCSNAAEARQMVEAAQRTGLVLMEAFHYRYHPLMARVYELLPMLGPLKHIETRACFPLLRLNDIRFNYFLGGGATMDVGSYSCDMMRRLAGASGSPVLAKNPKVIRAKARLLKPGVDRAIEADLEWENGVSGHIINSILSWRLLAVSLKAVGERGQLVVFNPVMPHYWHRLQLTLDGSYHHERVPGNTSYYYQLVEFERRIRDQTQSSDLQESIANMELIDAIYSAAGLPLRGTESALSL